MRPLLTNNVNSDGCVDCSLLIRCDTCVVSSVRVLNRPKMKDPFRIMYIRRKVTATVLQPSNGGTGSTFSMAGNLSWRSKVEFCVCQDRLELQFFCHERS